MNQDEKRIKIAEACGWKLVTNDPDYQPYWLNPNGNMVGINCGARIPDYFNDLNAMQSAILAQSQGFQQEFHNSLLSLFGFPHQATSTQLAEIFIDIALRKGIIAV